MRSPVCHKPFIALYLLHILIVLYHTPYCPLPNAHIYISCLTPKALNVLPMPKDCHPQRFNHLHLGTQLRIDSPKSRNS